jgi:hypothetical protein
MQIVKMEMSHRDVDHKGVMQLDLKKRANRNVIHRVWEASRMKV